MTFAYCKKCNIELKIPNFSEEEKLTIWGLKVQDFSMFAIQTIRDYTDFNLKDAKGFIVHINKKYGQCHKCNYSNLVGENIECPECKGFNLNWKMLPSFNQEFCIHLEFILTSAFRNFREEELKGFWCDGVSSIPSNISLLSKNKISQTKEIQTHAWMGVSGQDVYSMTIKLGDISLKKYLAEESMIDSIPNPENTDWINLDVENRMIGIILL